MNTGNTFALEIESATPPRVPSSGSAAFSLCLHYRFNLWRRWAAGPYCMFIGLNPSTADATLNDPTIRKCIKFAQRWNYGALCMTNLFAFRSTDPVMMMTAPVDPTGNPDNDLHLLSLARGAGKIVAAWGVGGEFRNRSTEVLQLLRGYPILRLGSLTDNRQPRHPLYLRGNLDPQPLDAP